MITQKARDIAKLAHEKPLENLNALKDLSKELRLNCESTLEEFLEIAGDLFYRPEDYFRTNIRPTQHALDLLRAADKSDDESNSAATSQ